MLNFFTIVPLWVGNNAVLNFFTIVPLWVGNNAVLNFFTIVPLWVGKNAYHSESMVEGIRHKKFDLRRI
jgi:hypothetical protein